MARWITELATFRAIILTAVLAYVQSPGAAFAAFTNVTGAAGLSVAASSRGAAWGDYNADGCVDLYTTGPSNNHLYQNACNGQFTDVTVAAGVPGPPFGTSAAWGDYDNDGDLDLFVGDAVGTNALYRNNGNGTFTAVASPSCISGSTGTAGAAWGDYDNDGDIDLFLATRYLSGGSDTYDCLYNNSGGVFTEVGAVAGVRGGLGRLTYSGVWFDYDADGDLDLYLAVDFGNDVLYRNNGNGTFSDASLTAGITGPQHGMGVAIGDYNGDGCFDVFSTNNTRQDDAEHGPSVLYKNNCNGTFTNVTVPAGILDRQVVEWGTNFVDFDNDKDLDLAVVAAGDVLATSPGANVLYRNTAGVFSDVTASMGVEHTGPAFGSAWADYDNDGDPDWYVANFGGEADVLFRNDGPAGSYFKVALVGSPSNKRGIGAFVEITSGGKIQVRVIQSGTSFLSGEEALAFFGVGTDTQIDKLRILWPSGEVDVLCNLSVNQRFEVAEGTAPNPTCGGDGVPPTWPGPNPLTAVPSGSSRIDLSWTAATDNVGVVGYRVSRGGTEIAVVSGLAYSDTGLSPGSNHCYTVKAYDAEGNRSVASNQACATTALDTTPPAVPPNLLAKLVNSTDIQLTWGIPSDNVGVAGYKVYRNGAPVGSPAAPSYLDSGLGLGLTYCYRVSALDASGNESGQSAEACASTGDVVPPTAPTGLTAVDVSAALVQISWTASTDDVGVAGYRVYRGSALLGEPIGTSWSDTTVAAETAYSYVVTAVDAAGNESFASDVLLVTTPAVNQPAEGEPEDGDPDAADPDAEGPVDSDAATGGDGDGGESEDGDGSGSGGCFIATAAFGSPLESEVKLLKDVRDQYLRAFTLGEKFIGLYYRYSPPIAGVIAESDGLRSLVRGALWPVVGLAWLTLEASMLLKISFLFMATGAWLCLRKRSSRLPQRP
jgi:chitodextrinase